MGGTSRVGASRPSPFCPDSQGGGESSPRLRVSVVHLGRPVSSRSETTTRVQTRPVVGRWSTPRPSVPLYSLRLGTRIVPARSSVFPAPTRPFPGLAGLESLPIHAAAPPLVLRGGRFISGRSLRTSGSRSPGCGWSACGTTRSSGRSDDSRTR